MLMKRYRFARWAMVLGACMMLLGGCRKGKQDMELTEYTNGTLESFSKKTGISLENLGNGNYMVENIVHVNASSEKIISVTLLSEAKKMTLFKVSIGMPREEAEKLLAESFTEQPLEHLIGDDSIVCRTYNGTKSNLKVTYDTATNLVKELTLENKEGEADNQEIAKNGNSVMEVGDAKVYYNEAMVYLKSVQENYETDYGKEIWDCDIFGDGRTFGDIIKDEIMKQIMEVKIICNQAAELGITLSEEELSDARKLAREHYSGLTMTDKEKYFFTQELLVNVYNDNMLAEKVYETVTLNVNTEVSDYEANQRTLQHIFVRNYKLNDEGKREEISADEKLQAYEKLESLREKALETEDFYSLAESNTEDKVIENTFGRMNLPEGYPEEFTRAVFSLKTGEVSNIITTAEGWYLIYCVNEYNKDATISLKESIIEQRRSDMFSELYTKWSADYDIVVNSETWKSIRYE